MKNIKYWWARLLALFTLTATLTAVAGDIQATMSGIRVAVISPAAAFGCNHVVAPYTTIHLSKNGTNYGVGWVRFLNKSGVQQEEQTSDYNVSSKTVINDRLFLAPYRQFPAESVEPVTIPAVGDVVKIAALSKGGAIQNAKVTVVDKNNGYINTDYVAVPGDSESWVTTQAGVFVGFVSSAQQLGSTVIIPGFSTATNAPATLPPTVVVDPLAGTKSSLSNVISQLQGILNSLPAAK